MRNRGREGEKEGGGERRALGYAAMCVWLYFRLNRLPLPGTRGVRPCPLSVPTVCCECVRVCACVRVCVCACARGVQVSEERVRVVEVPGGRVAVCLHAIVCV